MGADVGKDRINLFGFAGNGPGQLRGSVLCALGALGVNKIGHRLGGAQIHAPVQEGAFGKLPRQGLPGTESKTLGKRRLQQDG